MDTLTVATAVNQSSSFGEWAGVALVILALFIGFSLLIHGWPDLKKK
jgi:hypothetical protein